MENTLKQKTEMLEQQLKRYERVAVAFSGGVDSALLLTVARKVLKDNVVAITSHPLFFPEDEIEKAAAFCKQYQIRHIICQQDADAMDRLRYNPIDRCYICKKSFYSDIRQIARAEGYLYVLDGSIVDDDNDYRPSRTALQELDIKIPLHDAGFHKEEVRALAKQLGLEIWNKKSMACYATRFPYNTLISNESLHAVIEGEKYLRSLGFSMVRVRHHDDLARIEIQPEEMGMLLQNELRMKIHAFFQKLGYQYITVDLKGYATGSMNHGLPIPPVFP